MICMEKKYLPRLAGGTGVFGYNWFSSLLCFGSRCVVFVFLVGVGGEEPPLEEDKVEGSYGDTTVGEIEYRVEEGERTAADDWKPGWPGGVNDREIEHIHDLSEHQRSIVTENHSVEKGIYDVSEGSGGDEGKSYKHSCRHGLRLAFGYGIPVFPAHSCDPPDERDAEADAEKGKDELAESSTDGPTESEPFVLYEEKLEPVPDDVDVLTEIHIGLDQDLDDLVNDDQNDTEDDKSPAFG